MALGLVSPVFVGRGAELSRLVAALESAIAADPAVVIVGGEAGVGKTRLVEETAARAREAGARVLAGGCVALGGAGLALGPMVDALRPLLRTLGPDELEPLLGPAREELSRLLPELSPSGAPSMAPINEDGNARLLELMFGVVQRLAAERPLMLVVEDLQWADRSTLDLVGLLVRALIGVRVLLVVTFRSDDLHRGHPLRPLVSDWERVRSVQRLELRRFSRDETAGQLEAILGAPPERGMLELLYERSEGNAFLTEEIVGALLAGASPKELPRTLRDMLLVRAERLSPPTVELLRVASAAGRSVPDRLLSIVSDLDDPSLDDALQEAIEHQVLIVDDGGQGYRFRHALTRDAIYEDALPRVRVRVHRAYAEALTRDPTLAGSEASLAAALAAHWSAAHDLPRALGASIDAARLAASYSPGQALAHFEHALELWQSVPDAAERCGMDIAEALRLAAVSAEAAGEPERSLALYDEALAELDGSDDVERVAGMLEAKALVLSDLQPAEAIELLERVVAVLPAEPPTVARATALAQLLGWRWIYGGDPSGLPPVAEQALAAAIAAGAREQEATARMWLGMLRTYLGDVESGTAEIRRALDLAEELSAHTLVLRICLNLSDALEEGGRHAESAEASGRGLEFAERSGLTRHMYGVLLLLNKAEALIRLGGWREAHELLTGAIEAAPARSPVQAHMLTLVGMIDALSGRWDRAADAVEAASEAGVHDHNQFALPFEWVRSLVGWGRGQREAARELIRAALQRGHEPFELRYQWPVVWLGLRIEADAPSPDQERVRWLRSLAEEFPVMTLSARTYHALALAEGLRAAAVAAPGDADAVRAPDWASAVDAARAEAEPYLQAYALMRAAEQAIAADDRDSAARMLKESARLARELGAEPLLAEIQTLARRGRLRSLDAAAGRAADSSGIESYGLTEREIEVLRLVAAGRSNKQIATALFISPKTASVHVSNIMAKLSVSSRGEAAAIAHASASLARASPAKASTAKVT